MLRSGDRVIRSLRGLAGVLLLGSLAACASGGGGGGGGSAAAASGGSGGGPLRLVAVRRDAFSPSAEPRIWLVAERPNGAAAASFELWESEAAGGFRPLAISPVHVRGELVVFELAVPPTRRTYRLAAPAASNEVVVPAGGQATGASFRLLSPQGSIVARTPIITTGVVPGAASYLYAVADETGALQWLVEAQTGSVQVGGAVERSFLTASTLKPGAPHLATAIALDGSGFGFAWSRRVDFRTAP